MVRWSRDVRTRQKQLPGGLRVSNKLQRWADRRSNPTRRRQRIVATVAVMLVGGAIASVVLASTAEAKKPKKGKKKRTDCPDPTGGTLEGITYQEIVTGGADPNATLPMVIAFHGLGGAPKHMRPIVEKLETKARVIIPQGIEPRGPNYAWWQEKSIGDQAVLTEGMARASAKLAPFVKALVECRPTQGKPIIAGQSQGGMVALLMASTQPQLIDRAIAGSAWLPKGMWRSGMAPALLIHGTKDNTVPFERTRDMVEELTTRGNDWELEVIDGHGHSFGGPLRAAWLAGIENSHSER